MKTPHTFLVLAVLPIMLVGCVCGETHQSAGTKPAKLEMRVKMFNLEVKSGSIRATQVDTEIRNIGETTVLLPTKDIGPGVWNMGGVYFVNFGSDMGYGTLDGFSFPKAKSELAIVELRPREAIMLDCMLDETNVSPARVAVDYKISKEFAERYGTWHGEIGGKPVQSK